MSETDRAERDTRRAILDAAADLLGDGGIGALTTRAVASRASVQPPTLYRLFGDKRGLLNAVAQDRMTRFVADKASRKLHPDPVEELGQGWDRYVAFGLANPDVFAIMNEIGSPMSQSPATVAGMSMLGQRISDVAKAGRLRVPEPRAVALFHASAVGVVTAQLATPVENRDDKVVDLAREAALGAILDIAEPVPDTAMATLAVSLRARLDEAVPLSSAERMLLAEWLSRLADTDGKIGAEPPEPDHGRAK